MTFLTAFFWGTGYLCDGCQCDPDDDLDDEDTCERCGGLLEECFCDDDQEFLCGEP